MAAVAFQTSEQSRLKVGLRGDPTAGKFPRISGGKRRAEWPKIGGVRVLRDRRYECQQNTRPSDDISLIFRCQRQVRAIRGRSLDGSAAAS